MRPGPVVVGVVAALVGNVLAGCVGGRGAGPDPLAIRENDVGELELVLECSRHLSADVTETPSEIRIDGIEGAVLSGDDCEGVVPLMLDAPIGDRAVVVEGNRWVELAESCPWGFIGPATLGDRLDRCGPRSD